MEKSGKEETKRGDSGSQPQVSRATETRPHNQPQRRSASGNTATTWLDHLTAKLSELTHICS